MTVSTNASEGAKIFATVRAKNSERKAKQNKVRDQLNAAILDVDYCEGRLLRWANKLNAARTKRKRLERELAKALAAD